ncbi:MFS transporter [Streptacidiphilus melanogenes]|uniref:MFS transporter n=1 Tax=Streptacidiphilus melanogenes TaxID=411235 RepID=UPI001364D350|nr:MFS transporter [Streptacidiphilus melanogenes]
MSVNAEQRPRLVTQLFWVTSWRTEVQGPVERRLAAALTCLYMATGLSFSALAVFMLRQEHLSPTEYGMGASVAAVLGLFAGPAVGALADRVSGFLLYACLMWVMAGVTLCLTVSPPVVALGLLSVLVVCARGSAAVLGALVGRAVSQDRRVRFRAVVRAMSNTAMIVGLGLGALVLAFGTRAAFDASFAVEASALLATGYWVWRARRHGGADGSGPASAQDAEERSSSILRDRRVVTLMVLNWLFCLAEPMLTIGLPLWAGARMRVPMWIVSVVLVVNTIGVVLVQVPVARRVTTSLQAARSARTGALLFAIAAFLFPVAAYLSFHEGSAPAMAALVLLATALVCGDILYSVGSTTLMYELVPQRSYGRSQGIFGMGFDVASLSAPALFGWFAGSGGAPGWYALGVLFALGAIPVQWIHQQIGAKSLAAS